MSKTVTQSIAVTKRRCIVILDFGSQYTQLIARRIRSFGVYCEIHRHDLTEARLRELQPIGIVLSGGPGSVTTMPIPPRCDPCIFAPDGLGVPVLGICYGMQLMAHLLGGSVQSVGVGHEFGATEMCIDKPVGPLEDIVPGGRVTVWMSHRDQVKVLPPGFMCTAHTTAVQYAAMAHETQPWYGLQFHPEVKHTFAGDDMIRAFLFSVCKANRDWTMHAFADSAIAEIRKAIGIEEKKKEETAETAVIICAVSGGVDSSVTALLLASALGGSQKQADADRKTCAAQLRCVFVDTGLLRSGERQQVESLLSGRFGIPIETIDAADEFLVALKDVSDPETKRKIIGQLFVDVFERAIQEKRHSSSNKFLAQGTLYSDVVESGAMSQRIKSHHNVGGLPARMDLKLLEPLRLLFKDEVRALGRELGLPSEMVGRHPFPGPGLAIRCVGCVTRERLDILRAADLIVEQEVRAAGVYDDLWQSFAILLPVRSVGVMGDERTYEETCVLRVVTSSDGMTADWARLPHALLARISSRIANEVHTATGKPAINRVLLDITSKPPATIEWE